MVKQFFYLLLHLPKSRVVFVMFGGYWSLWPALMGRWFGVPVYIILGGTDCVSFPALNYGSLRKPWLSKVIRWSYRKSTGLLPVAESLVYTDYSYHQPVEYDHQGYQFFFPEIKTPHQVIYNGYDASFFNNSGVEVKKNSFITVGYIRQHERFELKGIDRMVELAKRFPKCTFLVVGMSQEFADQLESLPSNFDFKEAMPQEEFKDLLYQSEFYLQLSISEGFPNALCEAMLSGCIPIGSSVGAIPEIIGETGFVMKSSDPDYLEQSIQRILELDEDERQQLSQAARYRIQERFTLEHRKDAFADIIKKHLD